MAIVVQILLTVGASISLLLAGLSLLKRQKRQADYVLSFMHVQVFLMVILFAYNRDLNADYPWLTMIIYVLGFMALPTFYLYVRSTIQPLNVRSIGVWIHFVPAIIAGAFVLTFVPQLDPQIKRNLIDTWVPHQSPFWYQYIYFGIYFGIFPAYLTMALLHLRKHQKSIAGIFSYEDDVNLMWLSRFIWGMIIVWVAFLVFEVFGDYYNILAPDGVYYGFLSVVALVLYQGIYGLRQKIIFTDSTMEEAPEQKPLPKHVPEPNPIESTDQGKYAHSGLSEDQVTHYLDRLKTFMSDEKPYLEARITISQLSKRCGIPVNTLSQVINERLNQNFFDFINSYRVEEFKRLAAERDIQQFTLLSLAHEAGFNSKSTLNAIFKKYTWQTPSEFTLNGFL
ncbi:MAG: AraC family transcriptional regulator [Bacteroidota bacterium]